MTLYLFYLSAFAVLLCWGALLISYFFPEHRIWPPPKKKSWQYWIVWPASTSVHVLLPFLAYFDRNTLNLFQALPIRITSGIVLIVGIVFGLWAVLKLSVVQTSGLKGTLRMSGPYRFSRNPQYVGAMAFLIGLSLLSNSFLTAVLSLAMIPWYLLLPFIEEPWMKKEYRSAYQQYCKTIPRFL
ncbi:MAG: phosphatidylethanolamine N-methyltransferase family protein [bacterium]|nr:phosphatidylethanolamine N-methyltransferase family protein [bacterium]